MSFVIGAAKVRLIMCLSKSGSINYPFFNEWLVLGLMIIKL